MKAQLVLASASPRRKELLKQIGVNCVVHPVEIDETPQASETPYEYVQRVAADKSAACLKTLNYDLPVLAADTSVVIDGNILGKPENKAHAKSMLNQLSGNIHNVFSAVSLRCKGNNNESCHFQSLSVTEVRFRTIKASEIEAYWETGEPEGKAGAYAIQGFASIFVVSIKGSFSGVVGLPLFETAELLSKQGIIILHE